MKNEAMDKDLMDEQERQDVETFESIWEAEEVYRKLEEANRADEKDNKEADGSTWELIAYTWEDASGEGLPPMTRMLDKLKAISHRPDYLAGNLTDEDGKHYLPPGDDFEKHVLSALCPCNPVHPRTEPWEQSNADNVWYHNRIVWSFEAEREEHHALQYERERYCFGTANTIKPECIICPVRNTCSAKSKPQGTIYVWDEREVQRGQ